MISKRLMLIVLVLLGTVGLGNNVVYAAGLCVDPTDSGRCFTTIQAAVDAADDGDRITIRAGKYIEQVTILGKDLTLVGQSGAVIEAPADMEDTQSPLTGFEGRPIILVSEADVTISDLTVDGANSAEGNPFLQGIAFINAGGVIRDNLVKDIGFGEPRLPITDGGPSYQGDAIFVVNFGTTPRTITIAKNRVVNYNNNGIIVDAEADPNNPAIANLTAHVVDNTVIGLGPNNVIDQWGIFLGGFGFADPQSSITGSLRGNRVHDQLTVAPHPLPGIGIVTFNAYNVVITDNEIGNVNIGLTANQASNSQIAGNHISGPRQDMAGSTGLLVSGRDIWITENRFNTLEVGIFLLVEDPDFGSAINTVLDGNRFEELGVDVLTGQVALNAITAGTRQIWPKLPLH